MIHLSKKLLFATTLLVSSAAFAGSAVLFQQPYLLAFVSSNHVSGIYSRIGENGSCYFLFYGDLDKKYPDRANYSTFKINTFLSGDKLLDFSNRDKDYDIDGYLYKKDEGWVIRTVSPQAGCSSAQGIFSADPPDIAAKEFFTSNEIPAVGIRLVTNKSSFYALKGSEFIAKNSYLVNGDAVVVLKVRGEFSYIRYVDTGPKFDGRVTFGWLRSKDLVDPFPHRAE
ncbi:hypothetical protein [Burkholderia catarinensis]|uniref:hypothetical protein n=1 Tax=Burkholderia catarinensis TaxID=1108140 RepID=UPI001008315E|nr:hypothetical protein [Burkholderia catarinensis]